MTIAIAHEWLVRYAGSERVVEELAREYPDARLLTALAATTGLPPALRNAETSWLQNVPGATRRHEWLLPLYPASWWLRRRVAGVDAVVSSSHACARAVRIAPGIPHICYCHTPMRYAWDFEAEQDRFPARLRGVARRLMALARTWDRHTAQRVTRFVANSTAVAERIERFYERASTVVHPPVRTDFFTTDEQPTRAREGLLFVGRLVSYKRPDLAIAAARASGEHLTVVGDGHMLAELRRSTGEDVTFRREVGDEELRALYRRSRALVYPGEEDFGIVMAEAQACGTPVVALARGGSRDIVEHGETGWLVEDPSAEAFAEAIRVTRRRAFDSVGISVRTQRFSSARFRARMREIVEEVASAGG